MDGCVVAVLFNQFVGGAVDVDVGGHKESRISLRFRSYSSFDINFCLNKSSNCLKRSAAEDDFKTGGVETVGNDICWDGLF